MTTTHETNPAAVRPAALGASLWCGLIFVLIFTMSGGLLYGRMSNRWGVSAKLAEAGPRLKQIPHRVAGWELSNESELEGSATVMLQSAGDITRVYTSAATQATVSVSLIVGPVGTIAVHTPEVCFTSNGYKIAGPRKRVQLTDAKGVEHALWMVDFLSNELESRQIRMYYGWSTDGRWEAPESARYEFAGEPYLYRILLSGFVFPTAPTDLADPMPPFLREFLPVAAPSIVSTNDDH